MSKAVATVNSKDSDAEPSLGAALVGFEAALRRFRGALDADPPLAESVFAGADDWIDLLTYKLVPHLAGEGCLIAAVTGGTNTGKSTIFNLLLGRAVSPVRPTAAATCRPLLAAGPSRARQCLEGRLVPEFRPLPLERAGAVLDPEEPPEALFVAEVDSLPERLVLLDTPDVDSIETRHWSVAADLRAAGDVLIAVLTGEKYRDDRVVAFFREALAAGRVIAPVMNKADPADDYRVARRQLDEFRRDVGFEGPCFAVPHDFATGEDPARRVASLDGGPDLKAYLLELDVPEIKRRVFRATVQRFAERAGAFLDHADGLAGVLDSVAEEFRTRAHRFASRYDPAPGADVGGLFHEFVQARRGVVRRAIGAASTALVRGASAVSRRIAGALYRGATLESHPKKPTDDETVAQHRMAVEQITRDLAATYFESVHNLREPAAHLIEAGLGALDMDAVAARVVRQTLRTESISKEFREHAHRMIETWWNGHTGRRRALEAVDTLLALTPAAIAAPLSIYSGGVGVPEAVAVAGPLVEQFVARVIEYQFGDAMFDFLSPWREDQQRAFEQALRDHLTGPGLEPLCARLEAFRDGGVEELRKWRQACLTAL